MNEYRTGNHWGRTIIRTGTQPADPDGRRPDDQLVAVVDSAAPEGLAERICALLNGESGAPEGVQPLSGRFEIEAHEYRSTHGLTLGCNRCRHWHAILDSPIDLAELNQRADEHAEVCR